VRCLGEETAAGERLIDAGKRLRPQELGLLATFGVARVKVYRRLRVALLSSGNELREPGEPLESGQIYNSNRYSLLGVLQSLGCEVHDYPILVDDLAASREALADAASRFDLIIISSRRSANWASCTCGVWRSSRASRWPLAKSTARRGSACRATLPRRWSLHWW